MSVSASDWAKGIGLSILASIVGGGSKLAIRKSWLMEHERAAREQLQETGHVDSLLATTTTTCGVLEEGHTELSDPFDLETSGCSFQLHTTTETELNQSRDSTSVVANEQTSLYDPESRRHRKPWNLPLFLRLFGMVGMAVLNPLCCVLAMNYASPSILAPFSGLTLVWIILFSEFLVGERPTQRQVAAAVLIVIGEVVVAVFGDHTNDDGVSVKDVEESYIEPLFLAFFVGMLVWVIALVVMINGKSVALRRFAWGASGGSITGMQNFLKDSLTAVKASGRLPWALVVGLSVSAACTAFVGLLLLTACMKRFDAAYSSTMFVGSFVISASIMSAIHYDTFQNLESVKQLVLYPSGLLILLSGVYLLITDIQTPPPDNTAESQTSSSDGPVMMQYDTEEVTEQTETEADEIDLPSTYRKLT